MTKSKIIDLLVFLMDYFVWRWHEQYLNVKSYKIQFIFFYIKISSWNRINPKWFNQEVNLLKGQFSKNLIILTGIIILINIIFNNTPKYVFSVMTM